jgi:hypothetical protein
MTDLLVPTLAELGLHGFSPVTTTDELQSAIAFLPVDERLALRDEKPLIVVNKKTKAIAILRPRDGRWHATVIEPGGAPE